MTRFNLRESIKPGEVKEYLIPELKDIAFAYAQPSPFDVLRRALAYMLLKPPKSVHLTVRTALYVPNHPDYEPYAGRYLPVNSWEITKVHDEKCLKCDGQRTCFLVEQGYDHDADQVSKMMCSQAEVLSLFNGNDQLDIIDMNESARGQRWTSRGTLYQKSHYTAPDFNVLETGKMTHVTVGSGILPKEF